jgi:hypothetical protein
MHEPLQEQQHVLVQQVQQVLLVYGLIYANIQKLCVSRGLLAACSNALGSSTMDQRARWFLAGQFRCFGGFEP